MSIVSVKDNKGEIMTGLGTIINSVSIIAGGLVGHFTGKLFRVEQQEALNKACRLLEKDGSAAAEQRNLLLGCFLLMEERSAVESPCWWCFAWPLELSSGN